MTTPMNCRLIGRWRIVEADLWDRGFLDLVEPATLIIQDDGHGEVAFGAMQASLDLEYLAPLSLRVAVTFDHNGLFHLIQTVGVAIMAAGVRASLERT